MLHHEPAQKEQDLVAILILDNLAAGIMLVIEAMQEFRYFFFSIVNFILLILGSIVLLSLPVLSYSHSRAWTGLPILVIAKTILNSLRSSFYDISTGFTSQPLRSLVFAAGVASGVPSLLYLLMPLFLWRPDKPGGWIGYLVASTQTVAMHGVPVISRPVYVPEPRYHF
ncbi:hypothetical protein BCR37DRAFT_395654 [Protomyces lactucae-debilis]|uniref:Uncharacterized protein n=1 Tax=Protomyces lactucae-debilis TaxID=2754530 RepID=A0A1Y2ETB3_PROLT|nr:uncharacterized protein BCR37DRAFT_395654 [Protomyces lactucae-debilis]ORY74800.1 hypothetical protein BCR37DRAFT_395654 [Protomyces lactucae-debilis]